GADTVGGQGGNDTAPAAEGGDFEWPDDWRTQITDDPKELKRLERVKTPADLYASYRELEKKLASGQTKMVLDENSSEEDIAAYREQNGIPESAEGYLENLPDGLIIGEEDKEMTDGFLKTMHERNAPPELVGQALDWYQQVKEDAVADQAEKDKSAKEATEDALRDEWGGEYRANINAVNNFLSKTSLGDDGGTLRDALISARMADGTPLVSNPNVVKWLQSMASADNPAHFLAPGTAGMQLDSIEDEIASIEKTMRTNRVAYNKDTKMQDRLRELYDAQDKLSQRA
ncbi:MAG: hypothetical protein R3186_04980, partial [Ruegeria sp.]|nr:hypothetical protein [Ruegeria sp.]